MAFPLQKGDRKFTYGDYLTWPDEERWELFDGLPVAMTPAPGRRHQGIVTRLILALGRRIPPTASCRLYPAPFDVRLPEHDEADDAVTTVVQPDIVIVCDPSKLDDRGCRGAPDLVIEILSPSTAKKDLQTKRRLYEKHGVREYWIVQPSEKVIIVYLLQDGAFDSGSVFSAEDEVAPGVLPDVVVNLAEVFSED